MIHREGTLWFEEGLAQLLSSEKNRLEYDEERFKNFLLKKIFDEKWKIPKIENLWEYGNEPDKFDSDDYNGYSISHMLVRYLRDNLFKGNFYLPEWIYDSEKIRKIGTNIIEKSYKYYGGWLGLPEYDISLESIKAPQDLFNYMEKNFIHGWIDVNGERHEHTTEGMRDIYQINSLEQILESGLATCIE